MGDISEKSFGAICTANRCVGVITTKCKKVTAVAPVYYKCGSQTDGSYRERANLYCTFKACTLDTSNPQMLWIEIKIGLISVSMWTINITGRLGPLICIISHVTLQCHNITLRFVCGMLWVSPGFTVHFFDTISSHRYLNIFWHPFLDATLTTIDPVSFSTTTLQSSYYKPFSPPFLNTVTLIDCNTINSSAWQLLLLTA